MPSFDQAVAIYNVQMDDFGRLTTILTSLSAGLTGVLVIAIAINVLRARAEVLKVSRLCLRPWRIRSRRAVLCR
eukprot:2336458-Rhodomonas_salina.1